MSEQAIRILRNDAKESTKQQPVLDGPITDNLTNHLFLIFAICELNK